MAFGVFIIQFAFWLTVIGALFGIAALAIGRRLARSWIAVLWAAVAVTLGAVGAVRVGAAERRAGFTEAQQHPIALFATFSVFLGIVLLPPAVATWHAMSARRPQTFTGRGLRSVGWTLLGLVLALLIGLAVDLSRLPFLSEPPKFPSRAP
jgi:hypothetical protein